MALLNPTFIFGIFVLLYLSSFVVFAVLRIITGVSIQRIGYFSLRRLAYTPRDGFKIEIRGLGLTVHRPTFAQPTWLSIVVSELTITVDLLELEKHKLAHEDGQSDGASQSEGKDKPASADAAPRTPKIPTIRREGLGDARSRTWKQLTKLKERIKLLHRRLHWIRLVDVVATGSTVNIVGVGNVQVGSFTIAVDTRRKMIDRARFFMRSRAERKRQKNQAEWIMTVRSVLFTTDGGDSLEILDTASLSVHGFLYEALDGLRDASVALKLGRVHIPYDEIHRSTARYELIKSKLDKPAAETESMEVRVDKLMQELDAPGSTDQDLMQTVSDSKEFISSILRGVKEVQFAISFIGFTKKIDSIHTSGPPIVLNASMKEIGVDLHRLDPKSPAHRMYFPSKDIAHAALAAALSISIGLDDGQGKPERLMYIPMATTTVRTTLPSKTVELTEELSAEERNANILFANSVVTSPSVDLDPRHLPLLIAMLQRKPKAHHAQSQRRHLLISRLLPKANVKFSMHEPVLRISLPPMQKSEDPDEFDLIIFSISSISLDLESFHSSVEDQYYSLAASMRVQTHRLYYQTWLGNRHDLLETESFELKVQLNASPAIQVVATGNLQTLALKMVRPEITQGLRQIVRQLHLNVEPDKRAVSKTPKHSNFLRAMPPWLLQFQVHCSDFSVEVTGVDESISQDSRGIALQLESWSGEYRAQRLDSVDKRPSRRRAPSRSMLAPDTELLKAVPISPRKKYHHEGDGRRVAIHIRGLEAFVIESSEKWEIEPFVNVPRFEVALSTLSDNQGPVFHIHSHVKTLMVHYSLYRHYAAGMATTVLRKAFMRTRKDLEPHHLPRTPAEPQPAPVDHLSPPGLKPSDVPSVHSDASNPNRELVTVDVKATLIQIKADMPADPPLMLQIYRVEAGRHRWSPPFVQAKLIRLYAEAPRMRKVWARVVSIKNGRMDYRESRRKAATGVVHDERMFDIVTEAIRIAVPHELIVHKITDNIVNTFKSVLQLHHRFKTGSNEYILGKRPEGPKHVPKISLRAKTMMFELEDGAFEWKLGMIYRAGRVEQMQRQAREEAFRVKAKKIHEEEARKGSSKYRARSLLGRDRTQTAGGEGQRPRSADGRRPRSSTDVSRGRAPRYDPDRDCLGMSGSAHVSIGEAKHNLNLHNARSWKQRIDRHYLMARNGMRDLRSLFWGTYDTPEEVDDIERILEIPHRPALMALSVGNLHLMVDKPSFPLRELPDFLHRVGKGMPKDMQYTLLVPMNLQIEMGEARMTLRDYPLPLLEVPGLRSGQSSRLPALSLKTDFVIAEEFRGPDTTRRVRVQIVPPKRGAPIGSHEGSFAIDVRRTIGAVKSYSDMYIDINTADPTRITWGPSYQPAIQDMMMAIESFTKPQLDPSDKVGFWDKIRLSFHSRVRVAWRGDGDVHLALKGTRDPYQVTGDGAGFLMCWRNDVRWNIHVDDDPKQFMSVNSGEYVLAIPDYSHEEHEDRRHQGESSSASSERSHRSGAHFKKVVMKLSGKVQWLAGLVFERPIDHGQRSFAFKPHYDVTYKIPQFAHPDGDLPYDAFRGFRSRHIHLSIAVRAPVDRDWMSTEKLEPSKSYNSVHLTPRFFTHFFAWWSLFGGPLSLPIRQGALWPGREKNSKKFGRHLGTIKYNLLLAPLFLSHIYKHKDAEDYSTNDLSATGIKVRLDSWMLDLHQRREEFSTRDRGRKNQGRTTGMKIHAAQLDLVSADIRAVSASIRGTGPDAVKANPLSALILDQEDDGTDLSRFTIPDRDFTWIDMDDFVELDWILPTEPNPDTKILPLVFAPRITYFRQTDIGGVIAGDPDRTSPFGQEPTHLCIMSHDDDPRRVQTQLIRQRLEQLERQTGSHERNMGELELRMVRSPDPEPELRAEFETMSRHANVLAEKKRFMESMLRQITESPGPAGVDGSAGAGKKGSSEQVVALGDGAISIPSGAEFASDFTNRFVVHNMQLKWNNTLRNVILRYIHQVSQRRGFVYYLSRPAVKFLLDLVEEQTKLKNAKAGLSTSPGVASGTPDANGADREIQKDIEDRIRSILQDGKKFVNADETCCQSGPANVAITDLTNGIADGFTPNNSYHIRLIAPQIQLQSDKNKKHVVLIAAKGMELKVVEVMDKERMSDSVSGLVQRRFLVNMDNTQFFVTHHKWFSTQMVQIFSGGKYGAPSGSAWPPWVPVEVMYDFQTDPFGFRRVVQETSAVLRYDKYNTLRLKYNDDVSTGENTNTTSSERSECRMDNLWVDFPQARALCNSSQYYAIYVIVLDLLMFSEPLEKTRNERLEKIMLASDFSDLRGAPEMVIRLQERVRQLEDIKTHFQIHSRFLDKKGWNDRLLLERDLAACEDELFFVMKAITSSQRKLDTVSSALLKWSITAKEIVWHLIRDNNEPLVELQLKDVEYDRTDNSDGSHINLIQVGKILGLNLLPDAIYPEMVVPYVDNGQTNPHQDSQPMIQVYWNMLEAIAGIPVMDHFEVNLFPMKIQLEREVGKKLFEYIFPGIEGEKPGAGKTETPFSTKETLVEPDADEGDDESVLGSSLNAASTADTDKDSDAGSFNTRPGLLELRLRPTLNSNAAVASEKKTAFSIHSGEGSTFRFFRTGTGFKSLAKKPSVESLQGTHTPRPGVGRSSTGVSSKETGSTADSKKASRFTLRTKSNANEDKDKHSDDLTKMMTRASNYMTFAYIKMPSVVLCLSYKGKGDRNIEDVHDFVFRLPTIEYRNKTWSNLDLALALKSRVIKALISHTGAIIGNKLSKHRPNTAQQSKLRELANSSVLLPTPQHSLPDSRENSDDSSSLYGTSPVDFSRSPPRSLKGSVHSSSIPIPRSASRSSSIASARSHRSSQLALNSQPGNPPVPSFLMMTPPTPIDSSHAGSGSKEPHRNGLGANLLRPTSSGGARLFNGSGGGSGSGNGNSHLPRPRTSGSGLGEGEDNGQGADRRRSGGPGFLRGKFSALAQRLKEREGSSPHTPLSRHSSHDSGEASGTEDEASADEGSARDHASALPTIRKFSKVPRIMTG